MVQINFGQREVNCKVVYYGPAMAGKTTNIEWIHKNSPQANVGDLVSIKTTETDRTLYFDFLPLDLGLVGGMRTKFKLYTVPGQVYYNATRKLVLQGADGVVFVADSRPEKMAENIEAMLNLRLNLEDLGLAIEKIPLVLQYNLRDMPNAMPFQDMDAKLNPKGLLPVYSGIARDGTGVFSCLKEVSAHVIDKLNRQPPAQNTVGHAQDRPAQRGPAPTAISGSTGQAARAPLSATASGAGLARFSTAAASATALAAPAPSTPTRPERISSSTAMTVMRSSAPPMVPPSSSADRPRQVPTPTLAPLRQPIPAAHPSAEGLQFFTIVAVIIVFICVIAGAYALFPVNHPTMH